MPNNPTTAEMDAERCGWMREGGDMQCRLEAGHAEKLHVWGELPAWAFTDEEDVADHSQGVQEVPQMLGYCGREIQGQTKSAPPDLKKD
ncbi:MAG: hypothetical protein JWQ87_6 [Candidatus Sulfotelmatobacter sp.]|nr:hypothetical protein [Candidatus Sulfotelmatobacter sp.]